MKLEELPATISVPETARLLGIGRNQAYQAAARGELPAVRLGGRILILTAPLRRMLGAEEPARLGAAGGAGRA
jgi:excisionase family DNA binding protein